MRNVKWLFFDIGSTLVDEQYCYERRFKQLADAAGVSSETVYEEAINLYKNNLKGDLVLAKQYGIRLDWKWEAEVLYADAADCLKRLHSQYRIGIIANQNMGLVTRLEKFGIHKYIDLVVSSAEEGVAKPDKRIFKIAIERSGCIPQEAVMIGDRIDNDIVPAKAMGMHTIWIKQGFGKYWNVQLEAEKADAEVNNLTEVLEYFGV